MKRNFTSIVSRFFDSGERLEGGFEIASSGLEEHVVLKGLRIITTLRIKKHQY